MALDAKAPDAVALTLNFTCGALSFSCDVKMASPSAFDSLLIELYAHDEVRVYA